MIAIVIEIFEVVEEFKVPWGFGVGIVPLMRGSRKMEIWQIVQYQQQQNTMETGKKWFQTNFLWSIIVSSIVWHKHMYNAIPEEELSFFMCPSSCLNTYNRKLKHRHWLTN